jgi:hypothetical protein
LTLHTTIRLIAGQKSSGEPVYEELLVDPLGGDRYRVVASPGLVLGLASGDEIIAGPDQTFELATRGGNLSIHVYGPHSIVNTLAPRIGALGGWLDGRAPNLTVFTIPVSVGFPEVERVLNDFVGQHSGTEWYFANVYDEDGVTPLNWWT